MFTGNEDMEATALRKQGWSISAIARHLGRDRATIRNHLNGTRVAGERRRSAVDPFERVHPVSAGPLRLTTRHVWATALLRRGDRPRVTRSYQSFTRGLRRPRAAAALRGVQRGEGPGHHRDRAPSGRGDPVGLGRAARGPLGRRRPPAWSGRSRARASSAACSPSPRTSPI